MGNDSGNDCTSSSAPCATVQHAVDVSEESDEIRVATGIYADLHVRPVIGSTEVVTQVVYISKTVTIRGGYSVVDWGTSDPASFPLLWMLGGRGVFSLSLEASVLLLRGCA